MEKVFAWILDAMLVIFSILFLILGMVGHSRYYFDTKIITEYKENWERGPILDIITSTNDCPYDYEPFISNFFPGNDEGCDCTHSDNDSYKGKVYKNKCDPYQVAYNCKEIFEKDDVPLYFWKGQKLCILRKKENFWKLSITDSNCKKGEKKCGIFDDFNNILCVNQTEKCPINDIEILENNIEPSFADAKKIKLNNNYSLYYTNAENNKSLIVEIEARQLPVCVHPFEGELGENYYILNNKYGPDHCITKVENQLFDSRFEELDSESLIDFYNENKIFSIIKKFPNYTMPKNSDKVSLYKINYFGWNKKCFNNPNYDPNLLLNPQTEVDYNAAKMYYLAAACLIHFLFIIFSIVVYKIFFEKMNVSMITVFILDMINIICLIFIFSLAIVTLNGTNYILLPYTNFIENACGDKVTDDVLALAFRSILQVKGYIIPMIILVIIEVGYISAFYFWKFLASKKEGNRFTLS